MECPFHLPVPINKVDFWCLQRSIILSGREWYLEVHPTRSIRDFPGVSIIFQVGETLQFHHNVSLAYTYFLKQAALGGTDTTRISKAHLRYYAKEVCFRWYDFQYFEAVSLAGIVDLTKEWTSWPVGEAHLNYCLSRRAYRRSMNDVFSKNWKLFGDTVHQSIQPLLATIAFNSEVKVDGPFLPKGTRHLEGHSRCGIFSKWCYNLQLAIRYSVGLYGVTTWGTLVGPRPSNLSMPIGRG